VARFWCYRFIFCKIPKIEKICDLARLIIEKFYPNEDRNDEDRNEELLVFDPLLMNPDHVDDIYPVPNEFPFARGTF